MGAMPLRYPLRSSKSREWNQTTPSFSFSFGQCCQAAAVVFGVVVENVIVEFVGESPCEQFFVLMNTSVLLL